MFFDHKFKKCSPTNTATKCSVVLVVSPLVSMNENTHQGEVTTMHTVLPSATAVKMWSKGQGGFEGWSSGQDDKMYPQKVKVRQTAVCNGL